MDSEHVRTEEFRVTGEAVVQKIKELVKHGNIRRVILKNDEGNTLIEVPLTAGMAVGAAAVILFPVWAAIGAIAALATHLTIVVERVE
jgi:hypothetical protein